MLTAPGNSLVPPWAPADIDAAAVWSDSGARWLCDGRLGVPTTLVAELSGVVDFLDQRGAGLQQQFGGAGLRLLSERAAAMGLPPSGRFSSGRASRLVRCADEWVAITLARPDDIDLIPAWLEVAPFTDLEVWPRLEAELAERSAREVIERGALVGLPCAVVGEQQQAAAVHASRLGAADPRPLNGVVVVSLASLWAGPLCGDILRRLGARVIKVESIHRPDGGRAADRFFRALHQGCESVALDLRSAADQDRLRQLVERADVVIEGSRPRALEQMGIDAHAAVGNGPQVWLSITGHGRTGVASSRVGFGDDAAVAGGLVGWIDGEPRFVADAIADPLTGIVAAATVVHLLESGGRWLVDLALSRVAQAMVGDWQPARGDEASARPTPRSTCGSGKFEALPLGRDTGRIFEEFGIG